MIIGIDVGATRVKFGVFDSKLNLVETKIFYLGQNDRTHDGFINFLVTRIKQNFWKNSYNIQGIGIGCAGVIDFKKRVITTSPNFPLWKNFHLAEELEKILQKRVLIDNDANVYALGEYMGRFKNVSKNMIFYTLGTGVGGAIILNGELWRGENGMAGELGHINVEPDGFPCKCGSRGCLEQYASTQGIKNLVPLFCNENSLDLSHPDIALFMYQKAVYGNSNALKIFETMGKYLGIATGILLNIFNIKEVVIGGGLSKAFSLFESQMKKFTQKYCFPQIYEGVRFHRAQEPDIAGIKGAASLFLSNK